MLLLVSPSRIGCRTPSLRRWRSGRGVEAKPYPDLQKLSQLDYDDRIRAVGLPSSRSSDATAVRSH